MNITKETRRSVPCLTLIARRVQALLMDQGKLDMNPQITKTPFTCELVTIHSMRSFADLISRRGHVSGI
jgi:hypothetical protein